MNLGALIATLGIDSSGLLRAEKEMRNYEKVANTSMNSVNNRIKLQEGLIANVEKSIDALKQARKGAFSIEAIERYNKKIAEAEIHLKEYEQAGLPAEKQTNAMADGFKKLALRVVTVAAAWKTFKTLMESTSQSTVWFQSVIRGAKDELNYFMKSIVTADFSNFTEGMRRAMKAGQEYVWMMERIADIGREYSIEELELAKKIEEQRRIFYANDKTSMAKKIEAADKMLGYMKKQESMMKEIAGITYRAVANEISAVNNATAEQIDYAIRHYKEVEKVGREYNILKNILDGYKDRSDETIKISTAFINTMGYEINSIMDLQQAIRDLGEEAPVFGKLWETIGKMTEKEKQAFTDAINEMTRVEQSFFYKSNEIYRERENMVDRYQKEQEKLWKNHYNILYGYTGAFAQQMKQVQLLFPVPKLGGPMPDYTKMMMMFQPSYMQRITAELADIAARNAAFGDSLSGISQQAQFLTMRLNELWDQGMRSGDAVMDAMIEKYKELKNILAEPTMLEKFQQIGYATMEVMGSLSQYFSAQMARQIQAVEEYAKKRHKSELWVAKETEKIQKEMGKKIKAMAISQAIINAAIAITEIWKNYGTKLVTLPMAVALSALNAAKMGVEIATISAQPMAKGGIVPTGYPRDTYPALLTSGEEIKPPIPFSRQARRTAIQPEEVIFKIHQDELWGILKKKESLEENY